MSRDAVADQAESEDDEDDEGSYSRSRSRWASCSRMCSHEVVDADGSDDDEPEVMPDTPGTTTAVYSATTVPLAIESDLYHMAAKAQPATSFTAAALTSQM